MQRGQKKKKNQNSFQLFLILLLMTSLCSSFPSSQNTPFSSLVHYDTSFSSHSVTSELPLQTPPPTSDIGIAQPFSLATFQKLFFDFFLNKLFHCHVFNDFPPLDGFKSYIFSLKFLVISWFVYLLHSCYPLFAISQATQA